MALKASDLLARLSSAREVGILEDKFTIAGVELVIRNLTDPQHNMINQEGEDVPEDQYMSYFQKAQLSRAIVEVDGVDFRDSPLIEVEAAVKNGKPTTHHIERHVWIHDNLVDHWGREALFTAWRKLAELLVKADKSVVEGVTFDTTTETPEEKIRRLLLEAQELSQEIPRLMVENIWSEYGWMPRATAEELEAVANRAKEWQVTLAESEPEPEVEPKPEPETEPEPAIQMPPPSPRIDPAVLMANRTPLNQEAAQPLRPEQILAGRRAAYQADLEGLQSLDPDLASASLGATPQTAYRLNEAPAELRRPLPAADTSSVVIDQPATGGLNPRFKPRV